MSLHKFIISLAFIAFLFSNNAKASLYGFVEINPFDDTKERIDKVGLPSHILNYRQEMRENIILLTNYAKTINKKFVTIVNGGEDLLHIDEVELLTKKYNQINFSSNKEDINNLEISRSKMLSNINAISSPNALCGDNLAFREIHESGIIKIYIEKCTSQESFKEAIIKTSNENEILYVFSDIDEAYKNIKNEIIIDESSKNIFNLNDAKNISIITDDSKYNNKHELIIDIKNSNYDIVIMSPLFHNKTPYTTEEISSLKLKKNGLKRLVIAEMNISEANKNDFYYKKEWLKDRPSWLKRKSFTKKDSYIAVYWEEEWKDIIAKYFKGIVLSKFDGVWMTGAENYEYYEKLTPLK